jgi:hypothetical protein
VSSSWTFDHQLLFESVRYTIHRFP